MSHLSDDTCCHILVMTLIASIFSFFSLSSELWLHLCWPWLSMVIKMGRLVLKNFTIVLTGGYMLYSRSIFQVSPLFPSMVTYLPLFSSPGGSNEGQPDSHLPGAVDRHPSCPAAVAGTVSWQGQLCQSCLVTAECRLWVWMVFAAIAFGPVFVFLGLDKLWWRQMAWCARQCSWQAVSTVIRPNTWGAIVV